MYVIFIWLITPCIVLGSSALEVFNRKGSTQTSCNVTSLSKCRCHRDKVTNDIYVDCSDGGLSGTYPHLTYPGSELGINDNRTLRNYSFVDSNGKTLDNVKLLDLSGNNLTWIEDLAFYGLTSLETLLLNDNNLYSAMQRNTAMFVPLENSLKLLDLRRNVKRECISCDRYPGATVSVLRKLTELFMDGVDGRPLDPDFSNLRNLRKLVFSGGSGRVVHVFNNTFDSVSMVTELDVSGIGIGSWDLHVLKSLPNLQILNLCNNPGMMQSIVNVAKSLRWSSIEELYLNNTGIGDRMELFLSTVRPKTKWGDKIRVLTLDSNSIYDFQSFISHVFRNIEILSLGNNYWNPRSSFFADFYNMKHIVGLNMSMQQGSISSGYKRQRRKRRLHSPDQLHLCQRGTACPLNIPRNLQWVDLSYFGFQLPEIPEAVLLTNSSLNYINLAWTGITAMPYKLFCPKYLNILPMIKTWDFTSNSLQCINASVFEECSNRELEHLYLGKNSLGWSGKNVCNNPPNGNLYFLRPLHDLKILDLSENNLKGKISYDIFKNMSKLRQIKLASNGLTKFNVSLGNLTDLELLDLAGNNLGCLSESIVRTLDQLQRSKIAGTTIKVDLTGNPLKCNCSCLPFYKWIARTEVKLVNINKYRCSFPDGTTMQLRRLSTVLAKLDTLCNDSEAVKTAWVLTGVVNGLVMFCTVVFRLRHEIRYMWLKMRMRRQRLDELLGLQEFKHTAFISCDARDAAKYVKNGILKNLETKETSMRFCVAQRDFVVGTTIIDNIMRAIYCSRKCVFVITPHFLQSGWCREELLIAHNESLSRGKNILICVFTPEVDQRHLPDNIRMITRTVTCIRWPDACVALKVFYLMLHNALTDGTSGE